MKGQAFVGLPSEEAAATAVRETNGYQLAGKPMVVVSSFSDELALHSPPSLSLSLCSILPGQPKPSQVPLPYHDLTTPLSLSLSLSHEPTHDQLPSPHAKASAVHVFNFIYMYIL